MDIQPVNKWHVLILPKEHCESPIQISGAVKERMTLVAKRINKEVGKTAIRAEGINPFLTEGKIAGQEVFHIHLHFFPRCKNEGF